MNNDKHVKYPIDQRTQEILAGAPLTPAERGSNAENVQSACQCRDAFGRHLPSCPVGRALFADLPPPSVGDIMVEREGPGSGYLVSGCELYMHAICVSVEPFVMVSEEGDMMWTCARLVNFKVLRPATTRESRLAFDRFHKRGRWGPADVHEYEVSG